MILYVSLSVCCCLLLCNWEPFLTTCRIEFVLNIRCIQNSFDNFRPLGILKLVIVARFDYHRTILTREVTTHLVLWSDVSVTCVLLTTDEVVGLALSLVHGTVSSGVATWLDLDLLHGARHILRNTFFPISLGTASHCCRRGKTVWDVGRWVLVGSRRLIELTRLL